MAEARACATPLIELLRAIPEDARAEYEHGPTHHSFFPYGHLAHRAAEEISRLRVELSAKDKVIEAAMEWYYNPDRSHGAGTGALSDAVEKYRALDGEP